MSLINLCIYAYVFFKPFYLFGSGGIQISEIFIVIAFLLTLVEKVPKDGITKKMLRDLRILFIFILCVIIINFIYYGIYQNTEFLMSTIQYILIFMGIYVFTNKISDKNVLKNIYKITQINLVIQLLIYISGIGRYYDAFRYMGTFNDPNQFGYFIVLSAAYMYVIEDILKIRKRAIVMYFISLILIIASASTGMLMAMTILLVLHIVREIKPIIGWISKNSGKFLIGMICVVTIILGLISNVDIRNTMITTVEQTIQNSSIADRLMGKINKAESSDSSLIEERGIDKLIKYPQYLIYGSGQGYFERFTEAAHQLEVHSTLPGIWLYYGIVPLIILLIWVYKSIKKVKLKYMIPYIALFVESFTLYNQRQLLLWIIIIMANLLREEKEEEKEEMKEFGIKSLMQMYWSNKIILIVVCIVSIILGCVYSKNIKKPEYESTTQILFAKTIEEEVEETNTQNIQNTTNTNRRNNTTAVAENTTNNVIDEKNNSRENIEFSGILIDTYIDLIKSDVVIDKAIERIGTENVASKDEIINSIDVSRTSDTANMLEIKVVNQSPIMAQSIAKNVADVFLETIKEYYDMDNAYIVTEAKEPSQPYNMNFKLDVLVFFVVGFALATIIIVLKTMYQNEK